MTIVMSDGPPGFRTKFEYFDDRKKIMAKCNCIELGIGEGSQILTNQKRENSAFSLLIG